MFYLNSTTEGQKSICRKLRSAVMDTGDYVCMCVCLCVKILMKFSSMFRLQFELMSKLLELQSIIISLKLQ